VGNEVGQAHRSGCEARVGLRSLANDRLPVVTGARRPGASENVYRHYQSGICRRQKAKSAAQPIQLLRKNGPAGAAQVLVLSRVAREVTAHA